MGPNTGLLSKYQIVLDYNFSEIFQIMRDFLHAFYVLIVKMRTFLTVENTSKV
jgi:hypothetical protein